MPAVAAFVDAMRGAFGAPEIDRQIRAGMRGEPVFHGAENGHEVGTKSPVSGRVVSAADMVLKKPEIEEAANGRRKR